MVFPLPDMRLPDMRRYARQLLMPELQQQGQDALLRARVAVVGCGGLGAASISYMAAMGVGSLTLIDPDSVELSNLNRQILYETGDIGRAKVTCARERVGELNPDIQVNTHRCALDANNAIDLLRGHDIIIDGLDSFTVRHMLSVASVTLGIPHLYAALRGWMGEVGLFTQATGCYHCYVCPPAPIRNDCAEHGVIGALCGVVGSVQALEAVKYLTAQACLQGKLWRYDARTHASRVVRLPKEPGCKVCGA